MNDYKEEDVERLPDAWEADKLKAIKEKNKAIVHAPKINTYLLTARTISKHELATGNQKRIAREFIEKFFSDNYSPAECSEIMRIKSFIAKAELEIHFF